MYKFHSYKFFLCSLLICLAIRHDMLDGGYEAFIISLSSSAGIGGHMYYLALVSLIYRMSNIVLVARDYTAGFPIDPW